MTKLIRVLRVAPDFKPGEVFVLLKMDYRGVPPVVQAFTQLAAKRCSEYRLHHRTIGSDD